jgi:hypothetical protein
MNPITKALQTLFSSAKENLSLEELDTLAILAEEAGNEARRLSGVCSALACLVQTDGGAPVPSGSFQHPSGVFDLLCNLSLSLDAISGMIETGHSAEDRARELRERGRTELEGLHD